MKIIKKIFASSPKVNTTGFEGLKEKMKGVPGNFRQKAEQVGVPPERVKEFKYWLKENQNL